MSYFLSPAGQKIRSITRSWMARVMLCYSKYNLIYKDILNIAIIFIISLIILLLTCRISLKISNGERHEDIEMMVFLLMISIYCIIETGRSLLRARRSEKRLRDELKRIMDLEHCIHIGKFSKGIIHDLMTPLSSITLYIEELNQHPEDINKSREMISKAVLATQKMNKFMECTKHHIDSCLPINTKEMTTDLREAINDVHDIISYKAKISEAKIDIDIPKNIILQAHPMRIHQIFINILNNALESKAKTITVSTNQIKKSDKSVKISVTDDGCGIAEELLKDIFTKPRTTKAKGTGIGLTCIHSIIKDELSGEIKVLSKEGVGTTFVVQIPLAS